MGSSTYEMIKGAIINKQQIVATYNGHVREMCPHVIGTKNGTEQALCYQFGGTSSSGGAIIPGSEANWRCLVVGKLEDVTVRDGEWYTSDNHSQTQTCVDDVDVEVAH